MALDQAAAEPAADSGRNLLAIDACRGNELDCPNRLVDVSGHIRAIEDWARNEDIYERLQNIFGQGPKRFHERLRISICGCPNGCSRPQIADLGLVGIVRPEFDPAGCKKCGACAEVCPDRAIIYDGGIPWFDLRKCGGCRLCHRACPKGCIELSGPGLKITAGGRLGRRPRLAEAVAEAFSPEETIKVADRLVSDYIESAEPGERFADYWARAGKERREWVT
jgi:dissimilatory sulfite reductase (desulfoviridin) alpha/beta subunit